MSTDLVPGNGSSAVDVLAGNYLPVFNIQQAKQRRDALVAFTREIMVDGIDVAVIPGTEKKSLMKAGAEKLCTFFGMSASFSVESAVEDWTGESHNGEALFYYRYKCRLFRNSVCVGEGEGSANTWESKYRYRWVSEDAARKLGYDPTQLIQRASAATEFSFAVEKAETSGQYGKPREYWDRFKTAIENGTAQKVRKLTKSGEERDAWRIASVAYRVPNPDVADQINIVQKMAQKRALVAATLIAVNASEYFTQDVEDMPHGDDPYDPNPPIAPPSASPKPPASEPPAVPQKQKRWKNFGEFCRAAEALLNQLPPDISAAMLAKHGVKQVRNFSDPVKAEVFYNDLEGAVNLNQGAA